MPGDTRVFGVSLDTLVAREDSSIPAIVRHCADYLRRGKRLETEGLFRKQGFHALVEFARDVADEGGGEMDLEAMPRIDELVRCAARRICSLC